MSDNKNFQKKQSFPYRPFRAVFQKCPCPDGFAGYAVMAVPASVFCRLTADKLFCTL